MLTDVRKRILDECDWGVAHNSSIGYTQDLSARQQSFGRWKTHTLPINTDCSGALTDIYHAAGAPDPSGVGYQYVGNTASLYANSEHVAMDKLEPGDFIICFKGDASEHAYIIRRKLAGGDYQVFTHGDSSCPKYENLSSVRNYWNSVGHMVGCRTLPVSVQYRWTILTGRKVIARTDHPVAWAIKHPKAFRKHQWIRYRRDVL